MTNLVLSLTQKRRKLLDLHYADQITAEAFADEEPRLTTHPRPSMPRTTNRRRAGTQSELAHRSKPSPSYYREIDVDAVWHEATPAERRILVEDLVEAVVIHPDHLEVRVNELPTQRRPGRGRTQGA